jgi:peptidoglycan hydrolase-like protein with peptidoglycan-binding domain
MRRVILAGVSMVALTLGGCSSFDNMFHSSSSDQSSMSAQPEKPAQTVTNSTAPGAGAGGQTASPAMATRRDEVKMAQQKLQAAGLYKAKIDGIAGPKTRMALAQYQKQQGLERTGKLDRKTLAQLTGSQASGVGSSIPPANTPAPTTGQNGSAMQPGATPPK